MSTDYDVSNCALEPIHRPSAIQPHGVLLGLDESTLRITHVSANIGAAFGVDAESVLGAPVASLLSPESLISLQGAVGLDDLRKANPLTLAFAASPKLVSGILHRTNGTLVLELEPSDPQGGEVRFASFYGAVREGVIALQNARSPLDACEQVAREVFRISGFDRVCAYKFDENWNGTVVAEARSSVLEPYLGQSFPAADIPAQARALYTKNWLRIIVDAAYTPAPILGKPLDLSFSTLRSVSPVHLSYMKNMGTGASMSVSVIKDGKLWGLISCHNAAPRFVSFQTRSACEFLGQIFSYQMTALEDRDDAKQRQQLHAKLVTLGKSWDHAGGPLESMVAGDPALISLTGAAGIALLQAPTPLAAGQTPDANFLRKLHAWLKERVAVDDVFTTAKLPALWPDAEPQAELAAGLLAVVLSHNPETYLVWFRPEIIKTIDWAGRDAKDAVNIGDSIQLHPRKSFALWKEIIRGQAVPFTAVEVEIALDVRNQLLMRQLDAVNKRLEHSNLELEAFSDIIAHDLKEPLRGIRNYTAFAMEDGGETMPEATKKRLSSAIRLSVDMEEQITALLDFSRMGRIEFATGEIALDAVVDRVLERLSSAIDGQNVRVIRPKALPTVRCDRIRVGEVFQNLVANAIKYNKSPEKIVEISYRELPNRVYIVRDNGIGVAPEHRDEIFKMFRRLHARHEFAGTGAGLAITKRIVDRHKGRIWVEDAAGGGSTFCFTLGPDH